MKNVKHNVNGMVLWTL